MYQAKYILYFGNFKISETIVVQWLIMIFLILLSLYLAKDLKEVPTTKKQVFVEMLVDGLRKLVTETMGKKFVSNSPWIIAYIGTIFMFFASSNLVGLLGLRSPTTDLDTTVAWAGITVFMIYFMGVKFQGAGYFKSLLEPTPIMAPLNIIGEIARPISLSFRPFGNILGGAIIMSLLYKLLAFISSLIPNLKIPIGQLIIPVPMHIYFDIFAGTLQAFIFIMLTMVFVGSTAEE